MSADDAQRQADRAAADAARRRESLHNPIETGDVPAVVREELKRFGGWLATELGIEPVDFRFFAARPIDEHTGFWDGSVAWVAADRPAREMAVSLAHEALHKSGVDDPACYVRALELVRRYEAECPRRPPAASEPRHPQFFGGY